MPDELHDFGGRLGVDATDAMIVIAIERFRRCKRDWHMTYEDIAGAALVSRGTVKRRVPKLVKRGLLRCKPVYHRGNLRGFSYDTEPLWNALADVARDAAEETIKAQSAPPADPIKAQSAPQIKAQSAPHALEVVALGVSLATRARAETTEDRRTGEPNDNCASREESDQATGEASRFAARFYGKAGTPEDLDAARRILGEANGDRDLIKAVCEFARSDDWWVGQGYAETLPGVAKHWWRLLKQHRAEQKRSGGTTAGTSAGGWMVCLRARLPRSTLEVLALCLPRGFELMFGLLGRLGHNRPFLVEPDSLPNAV